MTSNHGTINGETKNNRVLEMVVMHWIYLEVLFQCITLTSYYNVKDIMRWDDKYSQ